MSPEPAIRRQLLIIIAANASREAEGKMLIESALKMELGAALIIRRGIDHVDCDSERGGGLDPGLEAEVGITPLEPTPPGPGLAVGRVCVPVKSAASKLSSCWIARGCC